MRDLGHGFGERVDTLVLQMQGLGAAGIGHDCAIERPLVAQDIIDQAGVGRAGLTVDRIVSGHHRLGTGVEAGLEGGQVRFAQVALVDHAVKRQARGFRARVNGKVFGRGDGLEVFRMFALHAFDVGGT